MQEQGKIRHIGLSEVTPAEIEDAEKIVPIVTVQNQYSLADRKSRGDADYCERRGIGFMPWYPIAGGKLLKADHACGAIAGGPCRAALRSQCRSSRWHGCFSARRYAADSRHVEDRASRRERGRGATEAERRAVGRGGSGGEELIAALLMFWDGL